MATVNLNTTTANAEALLAAAKAEAAVAAKQVEALQETAFDAEEATGAVAKDNVVAPAAPQSLLEIANLLATNTQIINAAPALIAALEDEIVDLQADYAVKDAELQDKIEEMDAKEVEYLAVKTQIESKIDLAEAEGDAAAAEYATKLAEASGRAHAAFKADGNDKSLADLLDAEMSGINGPDMTTATGIMASIGTLNATLTQIAIEMGTIQNQVRIANDECVTIGDQIEAKQAEITTINANLTGAQAGTTGLAAQRDVLRQAIITEYKVAPSAGDPAVKTNPQVAKIQAMLDAGVLDTMTLADAAVILPEAFSSVIKYENGNFKIPHGHDPEARATFDALANKIASLSSRAPERTEITRTDPIGFNLDDSRIDFIIDRNDDGIFNGQEEFLGAQNGWSEITAYDSNNDGQISDKELETLMVLSTNSQTGANIFTTAAAAGISSIDLASYQERNEEMSNGNLLAGIFNLVAGGQTVEATQTYDTDAYLSENYGSAFGSSIAAGSATEESGKNMNFKNFRLEANFLKNQEEELRRKIAQEVTKAASQRNFVA